MPRLLSAVASAVADHPDARSFILVDGDLCEPGNVVAERSGDFVYASALTPEAGRSYTLATSSWVALPQNVAGYLGTDTLEFHKLEGVTTKGLLQRALAR